MNPREGVVLPIRPAYADSIINGTKRVELRRRRLCTALPVLVFLYATAPTSAVVAVCQISECFSGGLTDAWERSRNISGISHEHFIEYFTGLQQANVFSIRDVQEFDNPVELAELKRVLKTNAPPQSYRYLDSRQVEVLRRLGMPQFEKVTA